MKQSQCPEGYSLDPETQTTCISDNPPDEVAAETKETEELAWFLGTLDSYIVIYIEKPNGERVNVNWMIKDAT